MHEPIGMILSTTMLKVERRNNGDLRSGLLCVCVCSRLESITLGFEDWITFLHYWDERIVRAEIKADEHFALVCYKRYFAPWRQLWCVSSYFVLLVVDRSVRMTSDLRHAFRHDNRAYHFFRKWTLRKNFLAMRDRFFEIKAKDNQLRYAAEVRANLFAMEMSESSEHVSVLSSEILCARTFCRCWLLPPLTTLLRNHRPS